MSKNKSSKENKPKKQAFLITIKGEGVSAFIQAVKREGMEYMPTPNPGEFKVYYNYTRQVMHLGAAFHELYNQSKQDEFEWKPVTEIPDPKKVGDKVLLCRETNSTEANNISVYDTDKVKYCDPSTLWQKIRKPKH